MAKIINNAEIYNLREVYRRVLLTSYYLINSDTLESNDVTSADKAVYSEADKFVTDGL